MGATSAVGQEADSGEGDGDLAKSLVCNDCGKKFRGQAQAEFHASKSGHVDFAESTEEIAPLTEEEKKARLEELREKLKAKREGMSEQDKIDKKRNEVDHHLSHSTGSRMLTSIVGNKKEEHQGDSRYQGGITEERANKRSCCKAEGKASGH